MNKQLETWQAEFGDAYTQRNAVDWQLRLPAFREMLSGMPLESALEVGCNRGHNLACIADLFPDITRLAGIEPNHSALSLAHEMAAGSPVSVSILFGNALDIPFRAETFDIVFTANVLIHVGPDDLAQAISEIYRVSRRYVLAAEYYADAETMIDYRGNTDLLWKRDYAALYEAQFPDLTKVGEGYWDASVGFDRTHWWLWEKRSGKDSNSKDSNSKDSIL